MTSQSAYTKTQVRNISQTGSSDWWCRIHEVVCKMSHICRHAMVGLPEYPLMHQISSKESSAGEERQREDFCFNQDNAGLHCLVNMLFDFKIGVSIRDFCGGLGRVMFLFNVGPLWTFVGSFRKRTGREGRWGWQKVHEMFRGVWRFFFINANMQETWNHLSFLFFGNLYCWKAAVNRKRAQCCLQQCFLAVVFTTIFTWNTEWRLYKRTSLCRCP